MEVWEDKTLSGIFRLTLNPAILADGHGNKLYFVPGVLDELKEQEIPVRMSLVHLEQAILEVASSLDGITPLPYLLGCWKRVARQFRSYKANGADDPKQNVLKEARRICMSYCIFAATMPDMFGWVFVTFQSWLTLLTRLQARTFLQQPAAAASARRPRRRCGYLP